jgi:hypothetical protein
MFDPDYKADEPLSTKDAIQAMLDGETLYDHDGIKCWFNETSGTFVTETYDQDLGSFIGLRRRPAMRKRLMTRWEILDWANSEASRGWVVRYEDGRWISPQCQNYPEEVLDRYQRAKLHSDLSGVDESTIQGFEVEE